MLTPALPSVLARDSSRATCRCRSSSTRSPSRTATSSASSASSSGPGASARGPGPCVLAVPPAVLLLLLRSRASAIAPPSHATAGARARSKRPRALALAHPHACARRAAPGVARAYTPLHHRGCDHSSRAHTPLASPFFPALPSRRSHRLRTKLAPSFLLTPAADLAQVRRSADGQAEGWASPREDLNAPDLYIPSASCAPVPLCRFARLALPR